MYWVNIDVSILWRPYHQRKQVAYGMCISIDIYLYMNYNIYPECHFPLMDTDMVFEMMCLCSELVQKLFVVLIAIKIQIFNKLNAFCYF